MKRAPISACVGLVLAFGLAATAMAQGKGLNQPARQAVRAERGIASAEVHITPTIMKAGNTSIEASGDRWNSRGYDLKDLISQIYDIDVRQIDFADNGSAEARYDVALVLPRDIDEDLMQQMLREALEKKFRLNITQENRSMDVYVLTAPNGPGTALHRHRAGAAMVTTGSITSSSGSGSDDAGQITYVGKDCSGISSGGIAATAGSIADFRRTLEPDLDRLLLDETHLTGSYDFKIGNYANQQELFKLLHEQLGIVVTPTQRKVTMLSVRPAQVMQAAM